MRTNAAEADASAVLWRVLTGAAAAHWHYRGSFAGGGGILR